MSLKEFIQQLIEEDPKLEELYKCGTYGRDLHYEGKPKKMALLYILDILRNESDAEHPLKKSEILDFLHFNGMDIDRKTAYSNIDLLEEEGLIACAGRRRGYYFDDWLFDHSELHFLRESVESSHIISDKQKSTLKNKIAKLGGRHFDETPVGIIRFVLRGQGKKVKEINNELFLNISVIKEAISKKKRITYDYYEYDLDKRLHKSGSYEVSPYEVFMNNQHYYVKAGDEFRGVLYHRLDWIKNIDITGKKRKSISEIVKYSRTDNAHLLSDIPPSMIEGELRDFKIRADRSLLSECIETFGSRKTEFSPDNADDSKMIVNLKSNITAMELWTRRHLDTVEILQPPEFKAKMYQIAGKAYKQY